MPRPQRCRRVCQEPIYTKFFPEGAVNEKTVIITIDELEVIRLVDLEKRTHRQCSEIMDISRSTVTEIYENAREKVANALVNGCHIVITGGNYRVCDRIKVNCCKKYRTQKQGEKKMKIAVTYENGQVFQHFGHTEHFKVYDVENGKVVQEKIIDTNGSGHSALADMLREAGIEILICGGIGGGARHALDDAGIRVYGGVVGNAEEAVTAYLNRKLNYEPDVQCDHHANGHGGEHDCGEHGCGGQHCN